MMLYMFGFIDNCYARGYVSGRLPLVDVRSESHYGCYSQGVVMLRSERIGRDACNQECVMPLLMLALGLYTFGCPCVLSLVEMAMCMYACSDMRYEMDKEP